MRARATTAIASTTCGTRLARLFDLAEVNTIPRQPDDKIAAPGKENASVGKLVAEITVANGRVNSYTRPSRASQYPLARIWLATRISPSAPAADFLFMAYRNVNTLQRIGPDAPGNDAESA